MRKAIVVGALVLAIASGCEQSRKVDPESSVLEIGQDVLIVDAAVKEWGFNPDVPVRTERAVVKDMPFESRLLSVSNGTAARAIDDTKGPEDRMVGVYVTEGVHSDRLLYVHRYYLIPMLNR